ASGEITPDTLIIAHHVVSPPKRPPWTEPLRAVVPDNTPDQWRFRREHACIFGSEAPVLRIISALRLLRQIRSTVNKSRGLVCKLMQPVPVHTSTRTVGRLFGRKLTFRSSMNAMTPPGLSAQALTICSFPSQLAAQMG